jgi:hypothetical protein
VQSIVPSGGRLPINSGWKHQLDVSTFQTITEYTIPYANQHPENSLGIEVESSRAKWLLPAAFYECCRYDLNASSLILLGCGLADHLKNNILIGYNKQVQEASRVLRFLYRPLDSSRLQPSACLEVRRQHADESFGSWTMNDPFRIWNAEGWVFLEELCVPCVEASKVIHAEDCSDLWKRLQAS